MAVQERGERTRSAIIAAASESFETVGFSATSLARIAEMAQVTKGALYYHFSSKQDLADAVRDAAQQTLQLLIDAARSTAGTAPLQAIIDLTHATLERLAHDPVFRAGLRLSDEHELSSPGATADPGLLPLTTELLDRPELGLPHASVAESLGLVLNGLSLLSRRQSRTLTAESLVGIWRLLLPGLVGPDRSGCYVLKGTAPQVI